MQDYERKYLHLRMLINDIKLNCYKINLLTAEALKLKDKLEQIEIVNNDTELTNNFLLYYYVEYS
jgi:hypothetical protein